MFLVVLEGWRTRKGGVCVVEERGMGGEQGLSSRNIQCKPPTPETPITSYPAKRFRAARFCFTLASHRLTANVLLLAISTPTHLVAAFAMLDVPSVCTVHSATRQHSVK